mmetsp:Transcript_40237/g.60792  ORF Transcript_40237/g.60792 Transcript_40237/m.60792 type:complete len:211 (+) Transcript_40237:54-686(+)
MILETKEHGAGSLTRKQAGVSLDQKLTWSFLPFSPCFFAISRIRCLAPSSKLLFRSSSFRSFGRPCCKDALTASTTLARSPESPTFSRSITSMLLKLPSASQKAELPLGSFSKSSGFLNNHNFRSFVHFARALPRSSPVPSPEMRPIWAKWSSSMLLKFPRARQNAALPLGSFSKSFGLSRNHKFHNFVHFSRAPPRCSPAPPPETRPVW